MCGAVLMKAIRVENKQQLEIHSTDDVRTAWKYAASMFVLR